MELACCTRPFLPVEAHNLVVTPRMRCPTTESSLDSAGLAMSRRELIRRGSLLGLCAATLMNAGCGTDDATSRPINDPWAAISAPTLDIPVITASDTSNIIGGVTFEPTTSYDGDPHFRYDGCHSVELRPDGLIAPTAPESVVPETITDARDIEVIIRSGRAGPDAIGVRVVVDGKLSHLKMLRFGASSKADYYYRHQFPTSRIRHLKFEIDGQIGFRGIVVGQHTVLGRPEGHHQFRHTAIGDSLNAGGIGKHINSDGLGVTFYPLYDYLRYETHSYFQSALMGCDSYVNLGVRGTGWVAQSSQNNFAARIPTAIAGNPDVLGFYGSRNDSGREAEVASAVRETLGMVQSVPTVLVCGPQQSGYSILNDIVHEGTTEADRTWVDLQAVAASPSSDPTRHPTFQEQLALAYAADAQIDALEVRETTEKAKSPGRPGR